MVQAKFGKQAMDVQSKFSSVWRSHKFRLNGAEGNSTLEPSFVDNRRTSKNVGKTGDQALMCRV